MVALGGNVDSAAGPPAATLAAALTRLSDSPLQIVECSPIYTTPCFPEGSGPEYVNAAVCLSGLNDPHAVLAVLHAIEAEFGRERDRRWGRRTLDLDLIGIGDLLLPDLETYLFWRDLPLDRQMQEAPDRLILPHPRLQDRGFVLVPLNDVAPDWRHPVSGQTVRDMLAALDPDQIARIRPIQG
ncbi:MAG: 2-amino-4-hydroxy-6-hydroxymethyldihydropteridine diphosphokinase [Rhodobacter sp.]|nr:2-amino-4-hydroxy-6-hydroxymethyldihydropteridine diphosphokinase [Rhodobacter sp.]